MIPIRLKITCITTSDSYYPSPSTGASFNKVKSLVVRLKQSLSHKAEPVLKKPGASFNKVKSLVVLKTRCVSSKLDTRLYSQGKAGKAEPVLKNQACVSSKPDTRLYS